jgi:putative ABC transport system permease protein
LGTVAGLLAGSPLAKFVIGSAEVEMVMFGRQIYPESFAMAALLTLAFALSVNAVMIGRLKRIDMIEALKTVE